MRTLSEIEAERELTKKHMIYPRLIILNHSVLMVRTQWNKYNKPVVHFK